MTHFIHSRLFLFAVSAVSMGEDSGSCDWPTLISTSDNVPSCRCCSDSGLSSVCNGFFPLPWTFCRANCTRPYAVVPKSVIAAPVMVMGVNSKTEIFHFSGMMWAEMSTV